MTGKWIIKTFFLFYCLVLVGCGTGYGIYHRVGEGETFSSICAAYGVSESSVKSINDILDVASIKPGDAIYIPGASRRIDGSKGGDYSPPPVTKKTGKPLVIKRKEEGYKETKLLPAKKGTFLWPVAGEVVSGFGNKGKELHDGIDIAADEGAPVKAAAAGRVIYSGSEIKGYGNMVILKHEGPYSTVYAHNSKNLAKKGEFMKKGDVIAMVGKSGKIAVSALHFEIREGKKARDPILFLP